MQYIRAHIKNDKNKQIRCFILDIETGIVLREKTWNKPPSSKNFEAVEKWLAKEYKTAQITSEGFQQNDKPPIISNDGVIVLEGTTVATSQTGQPGSVDKVPTAAATIEVIREPQVQMPEIPEVPDPIALPPEEYAAEMTEYKASMEESNLAGAGAEPPVKVDPPEETPEQRRERGLVNFKGRCDAGDKVGCQRYESLLKIVKRDRANAAKLEKETEELTEIRGNLHNTAGIKEDPALRAKITRLEAGCRSEREIGIRNPRSCERLEELQKQLAEQQVAPPAPPGEPAVESPVVPSLETMLATDGDSYGLLETEKELKEQKLEADEIPPKPKRKPTAKKAINKEGLSLAAAAKDPAARADPDTPGLGKNLGIAGDHIVEPVPKFVSAKTEHVISNRYNSWIVLGRDRAHAKEANRASGYGGKGHTQCASIDIVAGRMSPHCRSVGLKNEKLYCDPIFNVKATPYGKVTDAARIYISQKTDVDDNFMLADGKIGKAKARSAIALKADGVRIMSREGIKLVTRADKMNSQGGGVNAIRGVDIIAGNDDKGEDPIQPMVLGDNVAEALDEMAEIVSALVGTMQSVINNISTTNAALASHFHPSPFFGQPTLPSPIATVACVASLIKLASVDTFSSAAAKFNLMKFKGDYILKGAPKKIRSKYNNVN